MWTTECGLCPPRLQSAGQGCWVTRLKHVTDSHMWRLLKGTSFLGLSHTCPCCSDFHRTSSACSHTTRSLLTLFPSPAASIQHPAISCAFSLASSYFSLRSLRGERALRWGALEHDTLPHNSLKFQCSPVLSNDESETSQKWRGLGRA